MKGETKLCPNNFQIWVAFLMGMVVIVIAIVVFDGVSNNRPTAVNRSPTDDILDLRTTINTQNTLLTSGENNSVAWLGVEANDITSNMAQQLGLDISNGVLISRVIDDSPAEKAGLLPGDIIIEFDHRDVDDVDRLLKLISKADPGERVKLSLIRDNDRIAIYVELGESIANQTLSANKAAGNVVPSAGDVPAGDLRWGVVLSELTDQLRKAYEIPDDLNGVLVMRVVPGSAAARAGVIKGDLIRQVDKLQIDNLVDFFKALQSADNNVILYVYRDESVLLINVVALLPDQAQGFAMAQEGIGMNRPLYVPGYDQTQSGDPDAKTQSLTGNVIY
jgi:S1-C subfamily serine protease